MFRLASLGRQLFSTGSFQNGMTVCVTVRQFTSQDASAALRPFYFIVHPDLFGQHPKERNVNENSLKSLNEYLTSPGLLRKGQQQILTFYIRAQDLKGQESMKEVRLTLRTSDLRDTVIKILNSCGLPDSHVPQRTASSNSGEGNRPIDWHPSFYAATGRKNPHGQQSYRPIILTLRAWLQSNIERSEKHRESVQHIRNDITRLLHELQAELGLEAVRFDSVWGIQHFRGCLMSFHRLLLTHREFLKFVLKGKTLVFSNSTGVSRLGEIVLSSEDVPQAWIKMLQQVSAYEAVLARLPTMEAKLSELLNGVRVVRREKRLGHIMAERYEVLLNRLLNSLRKCQDHVQATLGSRDLSHLEMRVEGEASPLMLSSLGQFLIPASLPALLVVDFIHENMDEAAIILKDISSLLEKEENCRQETQEALELLELQKEESVTPAQMILCCSRLVEDKWRLLVGISLQGSILRVANHYSVMQDGLICIPWDWASEDDV